MRCSSTSRSSSASTCAWVVTSSAVVGSSAISTFGLLAIAIAIMTRWRMPSGVLVRVVVEARSAWRDVDLAEQLGGPLARGRALQAGLVHGDRLDHLASRWS